MIRLACDYQEGCHPKILQRLVQTNLESTPGYGTDQYCQSAKQKIKKACEAPDAEVFLLIGGTQTNSTVIRSILRPCEGVIAVSSGHINGHEGGAIEMGGHKVLTIEPHDGIGYRQLAANPAGGTYDAIKWDKSWNPEWKNVTSARRESSGKI